MTSLSVGLWCVALNLAVWGALYVIEFFESSIGSIPKRRVRQKGRGGVFRYFRDWHTMRWGDPIGLSAIDVAVSQYYLNAMALDLRIVAAALSVAFVSVSLYHWHGITGAHRPDSGHPAKGKTSLAGYAHLLYFYIQGTLCAWWLLLFIFGSLDGFEILCGGVGATLYLCSFLCDLRAGSFDLA